MALTQVTFEGMKSALTAMDNTVNTSRSNLNSTEATIRGLSATWTGAAASGFQRAEGIWEQNCAEILKAMDELMNSMQTALTNYQGTEYLNEEQSQQLQQEFGAMAL